mmetsp:Transcript_105031/g.186057  ORF Transcript_105031/g.186057 Transcript_105031/m.186057 type:complete len:336 (+) Transcript_105031:90-1097(+)
MSKRGAEEQDGPAPKKLKSAQPDIGTPIRVKATGRIGKLAGSPDDSPVALQLEFGDGLEPKEGSFALDKVEYLLFREKAKSRIGRLVQHTPGEELSHKLEFSDGLQPERDWFALNKIEVALFRVKADGRIGTLVQYDVKDKNFTHKLKFSDDTCDWFLESALDDQPSLERLHESADRIRKEVKDQLKSLQQDLGTHWDAYKKRLKTLAVGKAGMSIGKIVVGFLPGAHAIAEGASAVDAASLVQELKTELEQVGSLVFDMAGLYEAGSANLESEEAKLLAVLTRKVRVMGEHTAGGLDEEPGKLVVQTLMQIKALSAKLRTLDEMSFHSRGKSSS